jgi:SAM-dependent methyltransferase
VRHRLMVAALLRPGELSLENLIDGKSVLHFAPEQVIGTILRGRSQRYVTADRNPGSADLELDVSDMAEVASGEFDVVVACDVLEHVTNDLAAMSEIHRVLGDGGCAILTVPQKDDLDETYEDPAIMTPEARQAAFGQSDHVRMYGRDFPRRVERAGFQVHAVSAVDFPTQLVRRFVLAPPVLSAHPLATNFRKVFFARKAVTTSQRRTATAQVDAGT